MAVIKVALCRRRVIINKSIYLHKATRHFYIQRLNVLHHRCNAIITAASLSGELCIFARILIKQIER